MVLSGAQICIECLLEQEVTDVFGYPGAMNLAIYDELYRCPQIRRILTSHEQGAAHAADGYARATGKVGVCMATSGPGATNLVTGIATAMMDSVPIVAITCNVSVESIGKDSFQEIDIIGITMPITKHNFLVKDVRELADTLRRAFAIARTGRTGPVLVDIAKDVTEAKTEFERIPGMLSIEEYGYTDSSGDPDMWKPIVKCLAKAKKPLILVGGGAASAKAEEEIEHLAQLLDAPVCETLMGKGVYPGNASRSLGMAGQHGNKTANQAIHECDVMLALGVRFGERLTGGTEEWASQAKLLQIDIDPAEINKNVLVHESVVGDVKLVLEAMLPEIKQQVHSDWVHKLQENLKDERKEAKKRELSQEREAGRLSGAWIIQLLDQLTAGDAVVATDVGQHQMWTAQNYLFARKGQLLTSGGLGTMGYGLPAAIGAAIGLPGRKIFNIAGDGCFRMNMNELATVSRYHLPIIELVFDNHMLGMVHQWQDLHFDGRYCETEFHDNTDYVRVAEAMGVRAYRVATKADAKTRIEQAIAGNGPVVLVCEINADEAPLAEV